MQENLKQLEEHVREELLVGIVPFMMFDIDSFLIYDIDEIAKKRYETKIITNNILTHDISDKLHQHMITLHKKNILLSILTKLLNHKICDIENIHLENIQNITGIVDLLD